MKKYDMYDNELTSYIDILTKHPIHDIVGDIAGDILSAEIPANAPTSDTTIESKTALGDIKISLVKRFSQTHLLFSRQIGDSIFEEYTLNLDTTLIDFLVHGTILELREKGLIMTNIVREYDYCNHDDVDLRLVNSEEIRNIYSYEQIDKIFPNLCILSYSLEQKLAILPKLMEYLKNIDEVARLKNILPLTKTIINLALPGYIGINNRRGEYPSNSTVFISSNTPFSSSTQLYEFMTGNKTLERINDLLHGNITSKSIKDLKSMIDYTKMPCPKSYIYGFNRLADTVSYTSDVRSTDKLYVLEDNLIGPRKINLNLAYYEYLKELVKDTFNVELESEQLPKNTDIVELIKKDYRRDKYE